MTIQFADHLTSVLHISRFSPCLLLFTCEDTEPQLVPVSEIAAAPSSVCPEFPHKDQKNSYIEKY